LKVFSDSSPLIVLAKAGKLSLLPSLYGSVSVTPEVYAETTGSGLAGADEISNAEWIERYSGPGATDPQPTEHWQNGLGAGELSTIVPALHRRADLILLDDLRGRKAAKELGLRVLGCVGILYDAFQLKLIPDLAEAFEELLCSGAWVDRRLIEAVLRRTGTPASRHPH
jgi:predicted nucleic acid-binding protein